jgi:hypothetical protein
VGIMTGVHPVRIHTVGNGGGGGGSGASDR